jgi:hypothetical protein
MVRWKAFDSEEEATADALKAFHEFRQKAKELGKSRGPERTWAYFAYPRTPMTEFGDWLGKTKWGFVHHQADGPSGQEP